ncbi:MAG: CHAT domain-containing protein [Scytonema sp. PMC 1069.18]|nr:CHAT domain-containing protein [Scytonema sp. PMC 1069.18]MEC4879817.1 CHAT domain-containing protein [Scytonema sp. PMC 1070.18]
MQKSKITLSKAIYQLTSIFVVSFVFFPFHRLMAWGTSSNDWRNHDLLLTQSEMRNKTSSENQGQNYQKILKSLINQNQTEKALEIAEGSLNRNFVHLLTQKIPDTQPVNLPTIEQIKQVAKTQKATLVHYSLLTEEATVEGKRQPQESELLIWVIQPTGEISMRRVDLQAKGERQHFSFLNLIRRSRHRLGARSEGVKEIKVEASPVKNSLESDLKELHQVLIQPVVELLPQKSEERVIFIPQGELFTVPFAALQDANGKYLIEKHTISTAPSIQVLDLLYQRKNQGRGSQPFTLTNMIGDELLIVGNSSAPKVPLRTGEEACELSPLPGTEKEAKAIAAIFKTQPLIGDAATETVIVKKMPQAKIIHLATNVVSINCQKQASPDVIALASSTTDDGWLSTEEIQSLNLKADLVVLSSCDTALGKITGDGVIGLSRAFFSAGANSVIGSLWDVSDTSTVTLMTKFYSNLSKKPDKAGALRQAMLQTMKQYPNPSDWAAFTLIGLL